VKAKGMEISKKLMVKKGLAMEKRIIIKGVRTINLGDVL
jgi:hypothetical protein